MLHYVTRKELRSNFNIDFVANILLLIIMLLYLVDKTPRRTSMLKK